MTKHRLIGLSSQLTLPVHACNIQHMGLINQEISGKHKICFAVLFLNALHMLLLGTYSLYGVLSVQISLPT